MNRGTFARRVLAWFDDNGRRAFPWQRNRTPYRVWVSEIMLQQTRVETVAEYFAPFLQRFPDVTALANAPLDEVLHLWSGLGYYARARNLHRAARILRDGHAGRPPEDIAELRRLPGVGRSTAGAILALSLGQRHPILDGNVKRVLARHHGIEGWPGRAPVSRRLWALADALTPSERVADYTQAMMDLGAAMCSRARPKCSACPVRADCVARQQRRQADLPGRRLRPALPLRTVQMLLIFDEHGRVLLQRRPPTGLWGGLWGLPECASEADPVPWCSHALGLSVRVEQIRPVLRHTFSHFQLDITPIAARLVKQRPVVLETNPTLWYDLHEPERVGLAAPVARLLKGVTTQARGADSGTHSELRETATRGRRA